jgi:hypothetical protein
VAVAWILAAALFLGFIALGISQRVPEDPAPNNQGFPGTGFVVLVALGIIGLACLADAVRSGRQRRAKPDRDAEPPT